MPCVCQRQKGRMANITTCPVPSGDVDHLRAIRERLAACQRARQQHVVRVLREAHDDAWLPCRHSDAELRSHRLERRDVGRPGLRRLGRRVGLPRRQREPRGHRRRVLPDAGNLRSAAEEPGELGRDAASARIEHRVLVEVHRHLRVVAIRDGALAVGHHATHHRTAREQLRRRLHGDARGDRILGEDAHRRSLDDERAAFLHELREFEQPLHAHAAADVIGGVLHAEVRRQLALPVGNGLGARARR